MPVESALVTSRYPECTNAKKHPTVGGCIIWDNGQGGGCPNSRFVAQARPLLRVWACYWMTGVEAAVIETEPPDRTIAQGRILVWAIEALDTIEPVSPLERAMTELLQAAYKRCLRTIVAEAPSWVTEEILSANQMVLRGQY